MSLLLAAALAAAVVACLVSAPRSVDLRLDALAPTAPASPRARVPPEALCAAAGLLALPLAGPVPALLATVGSVLAVRARTSRGAARARTQERGRAVEACAALAAELQAGRTAADALAAAAEVAVGPCREALAAGASACRLGADVPAALRSAPGSAVPEVLGALGACWSVCATSGAGLAAAVQRLEEGLRAEQAQRRAVAAELAGPRATAAMLAVLPAAGLLLAAGLGADPVRVLLHTRAGLVCLVLGLALDGLGLWWTGRLVARAGGHA